MELVGSVKRPFPGNPRVSVCNAGCVWMLQSFFTVLFCGCSNNRTLQNFCGIYCAVTIPSHLSLDLFFQC